MLWPRGCSVIYRVSSPTVCFVTYTVSCHLHVVLLSTECPVTYLPLLIKSFFSEAFHQHPLNDESSQYYDSLESTSQCHLSTHHIVSTHYNSTMTALRVRASVTCQHITLSALTTTVLWQPWEYEPVSPVNTSHCQHSLQQYYDSLESTSQCHLSTHHIVSTHYNSTMTALRVRASVTCQHIILSALTTTVLWQPWEYELVSPVNTSYCQHSLQQYYDSLESTSQCHLSTHHIVSTHYNSTMTALRVRASVTCQHITLSALTTTVLWQPWEYEPVSPVNTSHCQHSLQQYYDSLESTSQCHLSTHHIVSTHYNSTMTALRVRASATCQHMTLSTLTTSVQHNSSSTTLPLQV